MNVFSYFYLINDFFKLYTAISPGTIKLLRKLDVYVYRLTSPERALADIPFQVHYGGIKIFEGTEEAIVKFGEKIDEIRKRSLSKGGSNKGVKNWLDE